MENVWKMGKEAFRTLCSRVHVSVNSFASAYSSPLLLCFGLVLLTLGLSEIASAQTANSGFTRPQYNDYAINQSIALLFALIEGSFGALVMVVAGLGAIIAAAFGAYRAAVGMLVVAVGAFVLRALVSLFFGDYTGGVNRVSTG